MYNMFVPYSVICMYSCTLTARLTCFSFLLDPHLSLSLSASLSASLYDPASLPASLFFCYSLSLTEGMGEENGEEPFFQSTAPTKPPAPPSEEEEEDELVRKNL